MDIPPSYSEQVRIEPTKEDLFERYFPLSIGEVGWFRRVITQEGANLAKERFVQFVKKALIANEPVQWRLLLQVFHEYLGLCVDMETGVGAFPHMKRMPRMLDFDLSKEEEQYGLAALMLVAFGSRSPNDAPQDLRYDPEKDAINFFIRCLCSDDPVCEYLRWDLEVRNASSKEERELVRLKATVENPS
jgi:hypothetical protein